MDQEAQKQTLTLILDKDNLFGSSLGQHLAKTGTVVLATRNLPASEDDVVAVPFGHTAPHIPDGEYSHIIFIWSKEAGDFLEPLWKKAEETRALFFLLVLQKDFLPATSLVKRLGIHPFLLVVGDLFGEGIDSPLALYLEKTKATKKISLPHMGLRLWRPILYQDAVGKIADILLVSKHISETLFIGPPHAVTALSLFHAVQKIDPDIQIDFSSENEKEEDVVDCGLPAFEHYNSTTKIQKFYQNLTVKYGGNSKTKEVATVAFSTIEKQKKSKRPYWYVGYILLVAILVPLFASIISGGVGLLLFFWGIKRAEQEDFSQGALLMRGAEQSFLLTNSSLGVLSLEASIVGSGQKISFLQQKALFAYQIAGIAENGIALTQNLSNVLLGKTLTPDKDAAKLVGLVKQLSYQLTQVNRNNVPGQFLSLFDATKNLSSIGAAVADELPQVLGVTGDRSYLVLFQNNMELRPGGGFIGSYGIVTLHLGAIKSFSIHNVYDADGQLKGHVEPPFPIRRYIPIVHLFLRDSNFDPDFTVDAKTAAFLLSQETGERVNGVVGVDLYALRGLLTSMESVYIPTYQQTATATNFFTLLEQHAEKQAFPGSVQKQEFLTAFFHALMAKLASQKGTLAPQLIQQAASAIARKDIMVAFSDPLLQLPFSMAQVSGSLIDNRVSGKGGFADFLGVVEANLGVNKVNAFVTRTLSQHVVVDSTGDASEEATLTLTNASDGSWPGGAYKDYVRFIVPKGAALQDIRINNVSQHIVKAVTNPTSYEANGFIPPKGLEVDTTYEEGKTLYGFLVGVPEKSSLRITVVYSIPHAFILGQSSYNVLVWKQPGVASYPYTLHITIPQSQQFLGGSARAPKGSQTATYSTQISQDTSVTAFFAGKGD